MRILISNDDGVNAPGIIVLATELGKIADIDVIAPDRNRSGASNSLSVVNPIRVQQLYNGYYSVSGTPTDCVHLALTGLFTDKKFDMVVSGINAGENMSDDVLYSGTVAAATEGRKLGLPAIAVSLVGSPEGGQLKNYAAAAVATRQIIERLKHTPLTAGTILNVNVPDIPLSDLQGFEVTRLGTRHAAQSMVKALDPRGYPAYWIGLAGERADAGPGTDFHAVSLSRVSITPLQVDMTDYTAFEKVSKWVDGLVMCKDQE